MRSAASGTYSLLETSENTAEAQTKSCCALSSDENMQWWFLSTENRPSIELQWNLLTARSGSVSCQSAVVPSSWISWTPCFLLSFSSSVLLLMLNPNSEPVRTCGLGGTPVGHPEPELINSITAVTKTFRSSLNVHPRAVCHAFPIRFGMTLSFTFSEEFEDFPIWCCSLKCDIIKFSFCCLAKKTILRNIYKSFSFVNWSLVKSIWI